MKRQFLFLFSAAILVCVIIMSPLRSKGLSLLASIITNADDLLNLINKENSVEHYSPSDLIELSSIGFKGQYIRSVVYPDLQRLIHDSKKENLSLRIVSSYRSYETQKKLFASYLSKDKNANMYSAEPGYSEHQLGTTIDFGSGEASVNLKEKFNNTPEGKWLAEHSYEYGFMMSYQKGNEGKTGYVFEPWHFRFIGVESAAEAHRLGLPLYAFLEQKNLSSTKATAVLATNPIPPSPKQARVIREINGNNIYYITDNGYRHLIPGPDVFLSYGNKWSDVKTISHKELAAIPETTLITNKSTSDIYKIVSGKKVKISPNVVPIYSADQISIVSDYEFQGYPEESAIN